MDKTNKLKQEIEAYLAKDYCCEFKEECKAGTRIRCSAYETKLYLILRFAEPKEKRIAELKATNKRISDECHNLVNSLEKKQNEIVALKAQIEKMKCCPNCRHSRTEYEHCRTNKHEKWEIKEN